ncbi:MAG TPA: helix-turn-helix domain-containing protein [Proteobacteria bacterium]|nr:helix-turn-helix domain-containing protein [Pseudomonadota bacterium]
MNLMVRDAARLLKVSEKTIYRWITQGKLPACCVNEQYRFNRVELLEWATARRINVSPEIFSEPASELPMPGLGASLQAGGIHYRISGKNREEVLLALVEHMRLPEGVDRDFLFRVLLAREELGSTGVGDGIAIPHLRNPVIIHVTSPIVMLCFLETPVDFGALDGKPVHTVFTVASPTVRVHLHVLSRLSFILRNDEFRELLRVQGSREDIFAAIAEIENGFVKPLSADKAPIQSS